MDYLQLIHAQEAPCGSGCSAQSTVAAQGASERRRQRGRWGARRQPSLLCPACPAECGCGPVINHPLHNWSLLGHRDRGKGQPELGSRGGAACRATFEAAIFPRFWVRCVQTMATCSEPPVSIDGARPQKKAESVADVRTALTSVVSPGSRLPIVCGRWLVAIAGQQDTSGHRTDAPTTSARHLTPASGQRGGGSFQEKESLSLFTELVELFRQKHCCTEGEEVT